MSEIKKDYYPYPGYKNYYQVTGSNYTSAKPVHKKTYSTEEVDKMINDVIAKINNSTHVVTENVTFATLPPASSDNCGVMYNITDGFVTDGRFLEGPGKHYTEGSNVIIVFNNGEYKYDVLSGEIGSATEQDISDIIDDIYKDE